MNFFKWLVLPKKIAVKLVGKIQLFKANFEVTVSIRTF